MAKEKMIELREALCQMKEQNKTGNPLDEQRYFAFNDAIVLLDRINNK